MPQCDLVAARDGVDAARSSRPPSSTRSPGREIAQRHGHVVARGDAEQGRRQRVGAMRHGDQCQYGIVTAGGNRCQLPAARAPGRVARWHYEVARQCTWPRKPPRKHRRPPAPREQRAQHRPRPSEPRRGKHTINDIARLANVSKKTVSRVINDRRSCATRPARASRRSSSDLGFTPDPQARALAFRRSFLIGLIYDNPNAPYVINVQEGALGALRRVGYELVVHPCDRHSELPDRHPPASRARQKLDGVVMLPPVSENHDARGDAAQDLAARYVRMVSAALDDPQNLVHSMDRQSAAEAAEHLAKLGHRRIAMIVGPRDLSLRASSASRASRMRSRIAACRCRRSSSPKALTRSSRAPPARSCCCRARRGRRRSSPATTRRPPASIARAYLRGMKIPDDLSVIGFDDSPLASRLCPSLTTMRQPIRDMGRHGRGEAGRQDLRRHRRARHRGRDRIAASGGARSSGSAAAKLASSACLASVPLLGSVT